MGTTTFAYHALYTTLPSTPTSGAGMLDNINGPWSVDTVKYTYDALGRVSKRTVDDLNANYYVDHEAEWIYDY